MIRAALLALATLAASPPARTIDGLPLAALPRQKLPARGCAAYLFTVGQTRVLAAVVSADSSTLRIAPEGRVTDLARSDAGASGAYGLPTSASYRTGAESATLSLTAAERRDLAKGASVTATITLDRGAGDAIVIPMAGLIGCA